MSDITPRGEYFHAELYSYTIDWYQYPRTCCFSFWSSISHFDYTTRLLVLVYDHQPSSLTLFYLSLINETFYCIFQVLCKNAARKEYTSTLTQDSIVIFFKKYSHTPHSEGGSLVSHYDASYYYFL